MFYKLIGHELHGGAVFTETQNPSDNHYALRRCLNRYLFIQRCIKWIPFIIVFKVREMAYLDGENVNVINTVDEDLEKILYIIGALNQFGKIRCVRVFGFY